MGSMMRWLAGISAPRSSYVGGVYEDRRADTQGMTRARPYPRVSNDTPRENAFCCVAPGVRLSDFAIFATGVF